MTDSTDAAAVLAQWQAREALLSERQRGFGVARPDQVAGKSRMQVFEAMLAGELPTPHDGAGRLAVRSRLHHLLPV